MTVVDPTESVVVFMVGADPDDGFLAMVHTQDEHAVRRAWQELVAEHNIGAEQVTAVVAEWQPSAADAVFIEQTFGAVDLSKDVVEPGAFRDSLRRRGASGVRMLWQHDPNQPIGTWLDMREDARGLYVRGRLAGGVGKAQEVLALIRAGAIDGLSIGYRTLRARKDQASGVRRLYAVDLFEVSVVTFPMLPGARVESIKRAPLARTLRRAAAMLRRAAG